MFSRSAWLGFALVALGLARAGALVAHEPLTGYGNQYDMHRTGACMGLFPAIDAARRYQATPDAPIARYVHEKPGGDCYPSTASALVTAVAVAANAWRPDASAFELRWVGWAQWGLLAFAALTLAFFLRRRPAAAVFHGLVVLLVLADPVATLWMNTLYTEFTVVWGLYASIGAASVLALEDDPPWAAWILLAIAIAALAFSKEQFAWLPVAFVLAAAPWLWFRSRAGLAAVAVIAVLGALVSTVVLPRPESIAMANRTNVYLGLLAPARGEPAAALQALGLPARCAPLVGASWYLRRGEKLEVECPEVFALPSTAFLRFADEPEVLGRAFARILPAMQQVVPPYVGVVAGDRRAGVGDLPVGLGSPLAWAASRLPYAAFLVLSIAVFLLAPFAAVAAAVVARPGTGDPRAGLLCAMLLGGTALYAAITTVFGDGLSEAARHYLAGQLATVAALLGLVAGVAVLAMRLVADVPRAAYEIATALVALLVVVVSAWFTLQWTRHQPLAIGVLDKPAGRALPAAGLKLEGWALDPEGVARVEVTWAGETRNATFGQRTPALREMFPGYPDAGRGGYTLDLGPADVASARDAVLRVRAHNRAGVATVIDERRVEITP